MKLKEILRLIEEVDNDTQRGGIEIRDIFMRIKKDIDSETLSRKEIMDYMKSKGYNDKMISHFLKNAPLEKAERGKGMNMVKVARAKFRSLSMRKSTTGSSL